MIQHSARERWQRLRRDAPRDEYFDTLRAAIAEYYLADPTNPYQQSGRSQGAERWKETRRPFVKALHRSGDFLDVGCANGLLLETLGRWAAEDGITIAPHGIDMVPELVELARQRFPDRHHSFEVANAFYWRPARQYDFVRTNLEYVPEPDRVEFVRRQFTAVAPGGRLIVSSYHTVDEREVDAGVVVEQAGYQVSGRTAAPGVSIAWTDAPASIGL